MSRLQDVLVVHGARAEAQAMRLTALSLEEELNRRQRQQDRNHQLADDAAIAARLQATESDVPQDWRLMQPPRTIEVLERQRYFPVKGWCNSLLPTDIGGPFFEIGANGANLSYADLAAVTPPPGWLWDGDWRVDEVRGSMDDGWWYAVDWPRAFSKTKGLADFVRQKVWIRSIESSEVPAAPRLSDCV